MSTEILVSEIHNLVSGPKEFYLWGFKIGKPTPTLCQVQSEIKYLAAGGNTTALVLTGGEVLLYLVVCSLDKGQIRLDFG